MARGHGVQRSDIPAVSDDTKRCQKCNGRLVGGLHESEFSPCVLEVDYMLGLECGHFWPGRAETDEQAREILALLMATNDDAYCVRCTAYRAVIGPVARVLERD